MQAIGDCVSFGRDSPRQSNRKQMPALEYTLQPTLLATHTMYVTCHVYALLFINILMAFDAVSTSATM